MDDRDDLDSIFINPDGYIEIKLVGKQTEGEFRRIYAEALPLMDQARDKFGKVLCLFDMTEETGFTIGSNKVAMEILEEAPYDKIAMYNVPFYEVAKGIIIAIGKGDRTKLFKTRREAVEWLKS